MKLWKLWNYETMKKWNCEFMKLWNNETLELWNYENYDTVTLRNFEKHETENFENYETVKLWNIRIMDCQTTFFDVLSKMKKNRKMSPNGTVTRQSSEVTRPSADCQAHICMYIIMNKREKERERKTRRRKYLRYASYRHRHVVPSAVLSAGVDASPLKLALAGV